VRRHFQPSRPSPAAAVLNCPQQLVATGRETSATLAAKLGVSPRQVNRYVLGLIEAGWQIERRGVPTKADYWFELVSPQILLPGKKERSATRKPR
jgi:hypothetical protein